MQNHLTQATREALAAAIRREIDTHRALWPAAPMTLARAGMRRALDIVESTPVPAVPAELGAPMPPHTPVPGYIPADPARVARHVDAMASPAPELAPPAPTCGDVDANGYVCDRKPEHLGDHDDSESRTWPLWYRDRDSDLWRTLDTDGERIVLDGDPDDEFELLGPTEDRFGPLARVPSVDAPKTVAPAPELAPAAPVLPDTVWMVRARTAVHHPAKGGYLSEAAAVAAAHVIAGEDEAGRTYDDGGVTGVRTVRGRIEVTIFGLPLHREEAPPHGLPVVGTDTVAAALGDGFAPDPEAGCLGGMPVDAVTAALDGAADLVGADPDAPIPYTVAARLDVDPCDPTGGAE